MDPHSPLSAARILHRHARSTTRRRSWCPAADSTTGTSAYARLDTMTNPGGDSGRYASIRLEFDAASEPSSGGIRGAVDRAVAAAGGAVPAAARDRAVHRLPAAAYRAVHAAGLRPAVSGVRHTADRLRHRPTSAGGYPPPGYPPSPAYPPPPPGYPSAGAQHPAIRRRYRRPVGIRRQPDTAPSPIARHRPTAQRLRGIRRHRRRIRHTAIPAGTAALRSAAGRDQPLAIASLVASLVGILCGIGSIVGIVLGVVALNQIKQTRQGGHGLAIAGIAVGVADAGLSIIWTVFASAPDHERSARTALPRRRVPAAGTVRAATGSVCRRSIYPTRYPQLPPPVYPPAHRSGLSAAGSRLSAGRLSGAIRRSTTPTAPAQAARHQRQGDRRAGDRRSAAWCSAGCRRSSGSSSASSRCARPSAPARTATVSRWPGVIVGALRHRAGLRLLHPVSSSALAASGSACA